MHSVGRVELLSLQLPVVIGMFCAGLEHLGAIEATFTYKQVNVNAIK